MTSSLGNYLFVGQKT